MHVPLEHQPEFFAKAQERYASLAHYQENDSDSIREALREAIAVDSFLAKLQVSR
jgi:hypothetical protein